MNLGKKQDVSEAERSPAHGGSQEFPKGALWRQQIPLLVTPVASMLLPVPAPARTRPYPPKDPRPVHGAWRTGGTPQFLMWPSCRTQCDRGQVKYRPWSKEQQIAERNFVSPAKVI